MRIAWPETDNVFYLVASWVAAVIGLFGIVNWVRNYRRFKAAEPQS